MCDKGSSEEDMGICIHHKRCKLTLMYSLLPVNLLLAVVKDFAVKDLTCSVVSAALYFITVSVARVCTLIYTP